ncbi:MAG: GIY-YIG nuclease family protein [Lewinellaceae bacterium]|nr:GIY-YIG nuclease family protein [Lewinellaceae bacterium]
MSKVSYTTYVLFSKSCNKTYIGQTQDLDKRLEKHNKGYVRSIKNCGPL